MNARTSSSRRGAAGFTLIELAVCVVVVVVMALALLPALRLAVLDSSRAACRDHLRILSAGNLAWAQDNNGWLVVHGMNLSAPRNPNGSPRYNISGAIERQHRLMYHAATLGTHGYVQMPQTWNCPSDRFDLNASIQVRQATSYVIGPDDFFSDGTISYLYVAGYNTETSTEDPANAPMFADESYHREQGSATPGNMPQLSDLDNHGAAFRNVAYLDGHVAGLEGAATVNTIWDGLIQPSLVETID